MTTAVLSLGSNLGDRFAHLRAAVAGFADVLVAASPVYETAPWGGVAQADFLNAVLLVADPGIDAWGWLRRGQALEDASGRMRAINWGPRTLDVDVVQRRRRLQHRPRAAAAPPRHARACHRAAAVAGRRPGRDSAGSRPRRSAARGARPRCRAGPAPPRRPGVGPMTPTRPRDLLAIALVVAVLMNLVVRLTYARCRAFRCSGA